MADEGTVIHLICSPSGRSLGTRLCIPTALHNFQIHFPNVFLNEAPSFDTMWPSVYRENKHSQLVPGICHLGRIPNLMLKVLEYKLVGKGMDPGKLLTGKLGRRKVLGICR